MLCFKLRECKSVSVDRHNYACSILPKSCCVPFLSGQCPHRDGWLHVQIVIITPSIINAMFKSIVFYRCTLFVDLVYHIQGVCGPRHLYKSRLESLVSSVLLRSRWLLMHLSSASTTRGMRMGRTGLPMWWHFRASSNAGLGMTKGAEWWRPGCCFVCHETRYHCSGGIKMGWRLRHSAMAR